MPKRRVVELDLDPPRLLALTLALLAALVGAFWLGRATTGQAPQAARPAAAAGPEQAPTTAGDVSETETIFDRTGENGAVRELGRQVTGERALGGRFELDLGTVSGRTAAERLKRRAAQAGVPAAVVGASEGRYRVAAGPFSSRRQAEQAARRLSEQLGREVKVRSGDE